MKQFAMILTAGLLASGCSEPKVEATATAHDAAPAASERAAASQAPPPAPTATTASQLDGPDVTGAYMPISPFTGEFAELDFLSLATIDENAAPAPLNGFLRPKVASAKDYQLVNPAIVGDRLTFATTEIANVQYRFDGTFAVTGNFPANPPGYDTTVLTGALTKLRNGKTVTTTPVKFRYEAGG